MVLPLAVALPHERSQTLGKACAEYHAYQEYRIGERGSGKLLRTKVAYHDIVHHLYENLSGLCYHDRYSQPYISLIEGYIVSYSCKHSVQR